MVLRFQEIKTLSKTYHKQQGWVSKWYSVFRRLRQPQTHPYWFITSSEWYSVFRRLRQFFAIIDKTKQPWSEWYSVFRRLRQPAFKFVVMLHQLVRMVLRFQEIKTLLPFILFLKCLVRMVLRFQEIKTLATSIGNLPSFKVRMVLRFEEIKTRKSLCPYC